MDDAASDVGSSVQPSTIDKAIEALANRHRRRLVVALLDRGPDGAGVVHVPDDIHHGEIDPDTLQCELHHVHLPKLEEAGFIKWDNGSQVVRGPKFDVIETAVERFVGDGDDNMEQRRD